MALRKHHAKLRDIREVVLLIPDNTDEVMITTLTECIGWLVIMVL